MKTVKQSRFGSLVGKAPTLTYLLHLKGVIRNTYAFNRYALGTSELLGLTNFRNCSYYFQFAR